MSEHHSHTLAIEDLTVSYNRIPAVHHISLEVHCGEVVALIGPNGAGKTTLLKALAGLQPVEGSIRFHGHEIRRASADIAYLPQRENVDWDFPVTVRGLVEMGRYMRTGPWKRFGAEDDRAVDAALGAMQLAPFANRQISALSGGQQQRGFLARALAQQAHVFLLDEPFSGLDRPTQESLGTILRQLGADGKLVIASHHDLKNVPELFSSVILLNGELIAAGPAGEVFNERNIARTFGTEVFAGLAGSGA